MTNSIEPLSLGSAADSRALSRPPAPPVDETRHADAAPVEPEKATPTPPAASAAAPQLHTRFKVDPDTQELTVFMVDPATRRVVRTIPAEELKNLAQGELLELLA
jgi:hypothetical protein